MRLGSECRRVLVARILTVRGEMPFVSASMAVRIAVSGLKAVQKTSVAN